MVRIKRLNPDELVQIYSYLLNLDRSLMTRKAAAPGSKPEEAGAGSLSAVEGDYLRSDRSIAKCSRWWNRRAEHARISGAGCCPSIARWCFVPSGSASRARRPAAKRKRLRTPSAWRAGDIWSAAVGGYNPYVPPPKRASTFAQEKQVESVGDILSDLDGTPLLRPLVSVRAGSFARQRGDRSGSAAHPERLQRSGRSGFAGREAGRCLRLCFVLSRAAVQRPEALAAR